jgi:hypothetical protein
VVVQLMRVPSIPQRKPDLLDQVDEAIGPAIVVEVEDQTWSRDFLKELDR